MDQLRRPSDTGEDPLSGLSTNPRNTRHGRDAVTTGPEVVRQLLDQITR